MGNFSFLANQPNYTLFAAACIEAEAVLAASPTLCALACRKALELAVKWVYAADTAIDAPYQDNLMSLIHHPAFRLALDARTWGKLPYLVKLGNHELNLINDPLFCLLIKQHGAAVAGVSPLPEAFRNVGLRFWQRNMLYRAALVKSTADFGYFIYRAKAADADHTHNSPWYIRREV